MRFAKGRLGGAVTPGLQLFLTGLCVTWVSSAKDAMEGVLLMAVLALSSYSTALSFLNAAASLPDSNRTAPGESGADTRT